MDPLTGGRDRVEPLPFQSMSNYPPSPNEAAPDRSEYEATWNTRVRREERFSRPN